MIRLVLLTIALSGCLSQVHSPSEDGCYEPPAFPPNECNEGHYFERPECVRYYVDREISHLGCCLPRLTADIEPGNGFCDSSRYAEIVEALHDADCGTLLTLDLEYCLD